MSPGQESRGDGVNQNVFWVTDDLLKDWVQLPDALPEQIMVARMIKYQFTGNLNSKIDTMPPFPGKERHLLRAQIARIFHATNLVPAEVFEIDGDTGKLNQIAEGPSGEANLNTLEAWVHLPGAILKAGRCTHATQLEEGDPALDADPVTDRLRPLAADEPFPSRNPENP